MSPLVGYHATNPKCRQSILDNGLLGNRPTWARPFGVYVFGDFWHPAKDSHTVWSHSSYHDLWQVAYIGPLMIDEYVMNGVILLSTVDHVTLVAGN